jgi:hypothetical protein
VVTMMNVFKVSCTNLKRLTGQLLGLVSKCLA